MIKRVLILSDSIALPRSQPEFCEYEKTWPELLRANHTLKIHQVSIGGATSGDLVKQMHYNKNFYPDIVILQFGIVDCAPRFASKFEVTLLRKMSIIGTWLIKLLKNKYVIATRKLTYVDRPLFRRNLMLLKGMFSASNIIAIGILPSCSKYEDILPGVTENIKDYNFELETVFGTGYLDVNDLSEDHIMSDYHHLRPIGHEVIYRKLMARIGL